MFAHSLIAALVILTLSITDVSRAEDANYYVANTRPPDAFLALRTHPSSQFGRRIMAMPNGTVLQVLQRNNDGWWYVQGNRVKKFVTKG